MCCAIVLDEAPVCNNTMSFGIAKKGFPNSGQQAFGEKNDSWGLYNNRSESSTRDPTKVYKLLLNMLRYACHCKHEYLFLFPF